METDRAELLRGRFMAFVSLEPNTGCWLWNGSASLWGYGQFYMDQRIASAHRASWLIFRGPIPDGYEVDHLCRVKICVNPKHLEPVTRTENMRRAAQLLKATAAYPNAHKTHCPSGHPYSGRNLLVIPRTGHRQCKACNRIRSRRWSTQRRAKAKALR